MAFPPLWRTASGGSGDLTAGPAAGSTTGGTALATAGIEVGTLSCLCVLDAETNTITLAARVQVSDDNSTWYDLPDANNAALTVFATGTGGADASVSKVIPISSAALGWKYVRMGVVNGVATGAAADTYAFTFHFRYVSGF